MAGRKSRERPKDRERSNAILLLIASGVFVWLLAILLAGAASPEVVTASVALAGQPPDSAFPDFLFALSLAIFAAYLLRNRKVFGTFVAAALSFLIFGGAALFLGSEFAFFLAVGLLLYQQTRRSFVSNNVFILSVTLFGSIPLGIGYPIELIVLILILVSVYDVFGVFVTRFIPRLAARAVELEVPLLLLAPRATVVWSAKPKLKDAAALLGAGDIFLPAIFLAGVSFHHSIPLALIVFAGAVAGGMANAVLATVIRTGIPAMPMLTAGMLAAYYLAR